MKNQMMKNKLNLFNKPTPIIKLNRISSLYNKNIYMKRDDLTGLELSGNKVRKLEYVLYDALKNDAQVIITCGAIQSNHARATAVACRMLGLTPHLVLRGEKPDSYSGNILLDKILDCKIDYLSNLEFQNINEFMDNIKVNYEREGIKAYTIPIGASNAIGNFGYLEAYFEILSQEKEIGINFSSIVTTVGSGGTYAGLCLGNLMNNNKHKIKGYSVGGSKEYFEAICNNIIEETLVIIGENDEVLNNNSELKLDVIDNYQGEGYALPYQEEVNSIKLLAKLEGIILDPVYTGKSFHGLLTDIELGKYEKDDHILFVHTGGHFGIESHSKLF